MEKTGTVLEPWKIPLFFTRDEEPKRDSRAWGGSIPYASHFLTIRRNIPRAFTQFQGYRSL